MQIEKKFLTPGELRARLGVHMQTLARWRVARTGPEYVKTGALVRYPVAAVEAWEAARTVHTH
jgi:predicted DNA-binding transcriptional regulator AlpA